MLSKSNSAPVGASTGSMSVQVTFLAGACLLASTSFTASSGEEGDAEALAAFLFFPAADFLEEEGRASG